MPASIPETKAPIEICPNIRIKKVKGKKKFKRFSGISISFNSEAFNKDNFGEISLDALCNHIKLCAEMGRKESDKVNNLIVSEKILQLRMYIK